MLTSQPRTAGLYGHTTRASAGVGARQARLLLLLLTVGPISLPLLLHLLQAQPVALVHVEAAEDLLHRLGVRVIHADNPAGFPSPPARCYSATVRPDP